MVNVTHEARANVRVKTDNYVSWRIQNSSRAGEGRVRNISTTGMLLETNSDAAPSESAIFSFVSGLGIDNFIPQTGQLVWSKKKTFPSNGYLIGVKFIDTPENIFPKLQQKIQDGMTQVIKSRQIEKVSGVLVGAIFLVLSGYMVWLSTIIYKGMKNSNDTLVENSQQQAILTQTYSNLYHVTEDKLTSVTAELDVTKKLYEESQLQLSSVNKELEMTKNILAQTEAMLTSAKTNNSQLKDEVQSTRDLNEKQLAQMKVTLTKTIATLEQNNNQLGQEVRDLRDKLDFLAGNVKNETEARHLLALYSNRIRTVKGKIGGFKRLAMKAKTQALKERDRIRTSLGNNGYLVRNGEIVKVDADKYNAATAAILTEAQTPTIEEHKVKVDVNFVN
jgi:hypothetical protein